MIQCLGFREELLLLRRVEVLPLAREVLDVLPLLVVGDGAPDALRDDGRGASRESSSSPEAASGVRRPPKTESTLRSMLAARAPALLSAL